MAGGPHHTCFTSAVGIDCLEDFAEIAGVELVAIGSGTTAGVFRRELRWNQAYYHLADGPPTPLRNPYDFQELRSHGGHRSEAARR